MEPTKMQMCAMARSQQSNNRNFCRHLSTPLDADLCGKDTYEQKMLGYTGDS